MGFNCQVSVKKKHFKIFFLKDFKFWSETVVCIYCNEKGGDSSMNSLVWYSWLGGVIIGTMTGANMVLEDHYRAGPRNVVITGR